MDEYFIGAIHSIFDSTQDYCHFNCICFCHKKSLVLETPNPIIEVHISDADYIITLLVLFIAFIVELVQKAVYLASNWAQVSLA